MTRKEAKKILPIITAFAEGKIIQVKDSDCGWRDSADDIVSGYLIMKPADYRIKPEPTYRLFRNGSECWEEMQKHQPFGWVKSINKADPEVFIYCECITKIDGVLTSMDEVPFSYDSMYKNYTFADGTPFGMKEE